MLCNGILFNSEVWHGIKEYDIEELEKVDEYLLRGIMKAHSKTSRAALYLESGCVPLRYILKKRRIMYLHHILIRKPDALLLQTFQAQNKFPVKGDWSLTVANNLKEIDIDAENIRRSIIYIDGINQKFDIEKILDIIFSDFCIGK